MLTQRSSTEISYSKDALQSLLDNLAPIAKEKDFEVWPENMQVVELFLRCQTQWRTSVAGITGLDYSGVAIVINMYGYKPEIFEDLQIMEIAAIELLNKEKK